MKVQRDEGLGHKSVAEPGTKVKKENKKKIKNKTKVKWSDPQSELFLLP